MYQSILVPVDLAHVDKLPKSLATAADVARLYGATVSYAGVTASQPSSVAHTIEEFQQKLEAFADEQGRKHGIKAQARMIVTADPAADLDYKLLEEIKATGADLVVMASHVPGVADELHLLRSNAGYLARHAPCSVIVVR